MHNDQRNRFEYQNNNSINHEIRNQDLNRNCTYKNYSYEGSNQYENVRNRNFLRES